jgi:putative ABC transport system permease protein
VASPRQLTKVFCFFFSKKKSLSFSLALRDLRGGFAGMRVVLACLALGVAAIAAVGSLRASIDQGLAENGRRLLGGDISVESGAQPLPDALGAWFSARGGKISHITLLRTLAVAPSGDRMLVELKAVDSPYPLIGTARVDPAQPLQAALKTGVVADALILQRLNLHAGDIVRIGEAHEKIVGALIFEPDHVGGTPLLGPRVLIAAAALPATKLIQPGSLVTHEWRIVLPDGARAKTTIAELRKAFPDTGWRIRDASEATSGLEQAVQQTSLFLTLVGLSALLVGGIGVATGVRAWLEGRARTIATLRCLGAEARTVFAVFGIQITLLCAAGILGGIVFGAAGVYFGLLFFGDALPLPAVRGIFAEPLLLAALYGLLTAAAFSLYPLGRAAEISGAALFRDIFVSQGRARKSLVAANFLLGALLAFVIVATSADRAFAMGFCVAALLTLAVFSAGAWALMRIAARITPPRPAWLSMGVKNLFRPASVTPLLLVSLGLGLATLATVTLVEGNIDAQFLGALPKNAPSFFFLDIQNDQLEKFSALARGTAGVTDVKTVPSLRARIVALNGVPAESAHVAPGSQWALRGDRGLTYSGKIPEGSRVSAGAWWPEHYAGPPLISLDADLAKGWGLRIGDTLRVNVLGRDIDFRVANLRSIDWRALTINFTLVASPGLLEHAPQMHIFTTREPPAVDAVLLRRITDALPNVTGIRVADVLAAVADLVGKLGAALSVAGAVTLASGALVLAGAVAAGQRRRISEAVVLKTLGASRNTIRAAWLTEFATIGFCAGLIAAAIGTLASFAVMHFVLHAPWHFLPTRLAATTAACICLMLLFGYAGTSAALRTKPASFLRN